MFVVDRGSVRGTIVAGRQIGGNRAGGRTELRSGDVIIVGTSTSEYVFRFEIKSTGMNDEASPDLATALKGHQWPDVDVGHEGNVRTWTPSSIASACSDQRRPGSSRAANSRAFSNHSSGTRRRPDSRCGRFPRRCPANARIGAVRAGAAHEGYGCGSMRALAFVEASSWSSRLPRFPREKPRSISPS